MSEQNSNHESLQSYVIERFEWLEAAARIVEPDSRSWTEVFGSPTEVRSQSPGLKLSEEQEADLRGVAGLFGIGGEHDILAAADYEIIEGGKPWKVQAEESLAYGTLIYAGTPHRELGQDELDHLAEVLPPSVEELPLNEYDMQRALATCKPGFVSHDEEKIVPFGYDVDNEFVFVNEPTGQLVELGTQDGKPVYLLRIDRKTYFDTEKNKEQYDSLRGAKLLGFVAVWRTAEGDSESSLGLLTSNTYASRAIDVAHAGLKYDRILGVGMYGRDTLAKMQGKRASEPTAINQIPGELHVIGGRLVKLQAELDALAS